MSNTKLSAMRLTATRRAPYLSHALLALVPVIIPTGALGVGPRGTMAVTPEYVLLIEEGALDRWTPTQGAAVLIHETLHVLRKHFARRGSRDPKIANYCEDMEINDDIRAMGLDLPDEPWFPEAIGETDGKPFEFYYEKFPKNGQQPQGGQGQSGQGSSGHNHGKGQPGNPDQCCGSGAGNPAPHEGENVPADVPRRGPAEQAVIATAVAHEIREAIAKKQGSVPAGLQRWAEVLHDPPEVPWQQKLAAACRRAVAYRPGAIDFKFGKMSRRQAGLGYGSGRAVLPALIAPIPQVAVLFDTSGSMGKHETESAARETDGVMKAIGAKIRFCVCDAMVHAMKDVDSIQQAIKLLKGGGGTVFNDAFAQLERSRPKPEVIVVMTDGYAGLPATPPSAKVIWCLIGRDVNDNLPWGEKIRVS